MRRQAAVLLLAVSGLMAGCGGGNGSSSSTTALVTVHGTVAQGLGSSCTINAGDQVTITDQSGKELAAPSLGNPIAKKYTTSGITVTESAYPFSAKVPPEPQYGISTEGNPPYYASQAQWERGIDLAC